VEGSSRSEPRLDIDASFTSCHEAGHAVGRYIVHGTTGAISPEPLPDKEAGAESEALPPDLREPDPKRQGDERLVDGPYSSSQRAPLEKEIKTTLGGSAAEGLVRGKPALEVLEETPQRSNWNVVWGIAKQLWPNSIDREREVERLAEEITNELDDVWGTVMAVAEAYESRGQLTGAEVAELVGRRTT
jgi:hypothetical protein